MVTQVPSHGEQEQHLTLHRGVETVDAVGCLQEVLQVNHRLCGIGPDALDVQQNVGQVLQVTLRVGGLAPGRPDRTKALMEARTRSLVSGFVSPVPAHLKQLQMRQQVVAVGVQQVLQKQIQGSLFLPQHGEELHLLLQIQQLIDGNARQRNRRRRRNQRRLHMSRKRRTGLRLSGRHRSTP